MSRYCPDCEIQRKARTDGQWHFCAVCGTTLGRNFDAQTQQHSAEVQQHSVENQQQNSVQNQHQTEDTE